MDVQNRKIEIRALFFLTHSYIVCAVGQNNLWVFSSVGRARRGCGVSHLLVLRRGQEFDSPKIHFFFCPFLLRPLAPQPEKDFFSPSPSQKAVLREEKRSPRVTVRLSTARTVILERTNADVSPVPGQELLDALTGVGRILVDTGSVDYQHQVDAALASILDTRFAEEAIR